MARANADLERLLVEISSLRDQVAALRAGDVACTARPHGMMRDAVVVVDAVADGTRSIRARVRQQPLLSLAGSFALGLAVARIARL